MTRLRVLLAPVAVVAFEGYLYRAYAEIDAVLHFWLHALIGALLAIAALTLVALARHRRPGGVWAAGGIGHLVSAIPDVLFLVAGLLHVAWMDVFALHITVHFIPVPLATLFVLFVAALAAWCAALYGRRRVAIGALAGIAVALVTVFAVADEPPSTLQELRSAPRLVLTCPLATVEEVVHRGVTPSREQRLLADGAATRAARR